MKLTMFLDIKIMLMFRVIPIYGKCFVYNPSKIATLVHTPKKNGKKKPYRPMGLYSKHNTAIKTHVSI